MLPSTQDGQDLSPAATFRRTGRGNLTHMRVLLWHLHGSWTDAFVRGRHHYLVVDDGPQRWPDGVEQVGREQLRDSRPDVVVFQRPDEPERFARAFGVEAGSVGKIYLEHNTPDGPAATSRHPMADRDDLLLVHVTWFNQLMWDSGTTPTVVIEHGIPDPGYRYTGEFGRQAAVINEAGRRGRAVGADLLPMLAEAAPIDLFGIDADRYTAENRGAEVTAAGNLDLEQLHTEMARRRLYLHTSRWTSLGLSLIEAMHLGMPVVALAATEAPRAVPPGTGVVSNDPGRLVETIEMLIKNPELARSLGEAARAHALEHFGLGRFLADWDEVLEDCRRVPRRAPAQ